MIASQSAYIEVIQLSTHIKECAEFYSKLSNDKSEVDLLRVKNIDKGSWVELIVRPKAERCGRFDCVFALRSSSSDNFRCEHLNISVKSTDMFIDSRLTNLFVLLKTAYANHAPEVVYQASKAVFSGQEDLHLLVNGYKITEAMHSALIHKDRQQQNTVVRPQQQRISTVETTAESLKEVASQVNKYAKKIIESKIIMNKFTSELEQEITSIKATLVPDKLATDILKGSIARLKKVPREGLFAMNTGHFYTTFATENSRIGDIRRYDKPFEQYANFLGGGWFYHRNQATGDHMFYVVGGSFNQTSISMSNSSANLDGKLSYQDKVVAFTIDQSGTDKGLKPYLNDERLKVNFPAVTYMREQGSAFIIGGIKPDMLPSDQILEYRVSQNTLTYAAKMARKRYNHSACCHLGKIYVSGGIDYDEYLKDNKDTKGPKIMPLERITELNSKYAASTIEIHTLVNGGPPVNVKVCKLQMAGSYLMLRNISVVLPVADKDMLVLFGGNSGVRTMVIGAALGCCLNDNDPTWDFFGQNNLNREQIIGEDKALSPNSMIVDFEGCQLQNSVTFMVTDIRGAKPSILTFTAKGAERTYRWVN